MRHKFGTENGFFPKCATSVPKSFRSLRAQAKPTFTAHRRRASPPRPPFSIEAARSCGRAMEDGREPGEESGAGGGAPQRDPITDQTQAARMDGYFTRPAPGTRAPATQPPPGPRATAQRASSTRRGSGRVQVRHHHTESVSSVGMGDGRGYLSRKRVTDEYHRTSTVQTTSAPNQGLHREVRRDLHASN